MMQIVPSNYGYSKIKNFLDVSNGNLSRLLPYISNNRFVHIYLELNECRSESSRVLLSVPPNEFRSS